MEMKINAEKVIAERKKRAWSQQHLAEVSALSLRTIQRVENNGSGSLETIKALAASFELSANILFVQKAEPIESKPKMAAFFAFIMAIVSSVFFIVPASMASDITITAENQGVISDEGYISFSDNVEIFVPNDINYEVKVNSNLESSNSSDSNTSVKIYLNNATVFIDQATISKEANGVRITTDYAKFFKLQS